VPFILIGDRFLHRKLRPGGALRDIAPTILAIMDLELPPEMDGESLLQ
jgi:2,3-bisphosphoglycerate-independent phosphoglycerate mutase